MITYRNYHPIAYRNEQFVPVPGWGMHPILAGSPVIAIGGMGLDVPIQTPLGTTKVTIPIESITKSAVESAWPEIQPKFQAEIDRGLGEMRRMNYILGGTIIAAVIASAWWIKSKK